MSYLGRHQLGESVRLLCLTRNGSDTPTVPQDVPTAYVYGPGGKTVAVKLPVTDRYAQTGLFALDLFLGADYGLGSYRVVYAYQVGSFLGLDEDSFEIVDGGDPGGAVLAAHFWERPQARFIVQQLTSGQLVYGRNPRLP